jgi:hypothetical protein
MNKNTKRARRAGYSSRRDYEAKSHKIYRGDICDTAWNNPNSKKRYAKKYKKHPIVDDDDDE